MFCRGEVTSAAEASVSFDTQLWDSPTRALGVRRDSPGLVPTANGGRVGDLGRPHCAYGSHPDASSSPGRARLAPLTVLTSSPTTLLVHTRLLVSAGCDRSADLLAGSASCSSAEQKDVTNTGSIGDRNRVLREIESATLGNAACKATGTHL